MVKSPKNILILLLAITTLGGAIVAWRQYNELLELRAAAMARTERADLQKRVWDLEKLNRELRDLAAARAAGDTGAQPAATDGRSQTREVSASARLAARRDADQQYNAVRDLMNKPEVQALISQQQKGAIESRYAPLFKNLNLAPAQVEKLEALLAERSTTMMDIMSAARDQGVNPRENPEAFRKLVTDAQEDINKGIRSVIGDQGFAQLSNYEQTLPQRGIVNELQQRLSYTSTPLTGVQAEQLVQILAANPPQRPATTSGDRGSATPPSTSPGAGRAAPAGIDLGSLGVRGPDVAGIVANVLSGGPGFVTGPPDAGSRGGSVNPVTPAAVTQSQTILAPPQVAALQQMQQQIQGQQQLRQMVNDTLTANQSANGRGTPPAGPPPGGKK